MNIDHKKHTDSSLQLIIVQLITILNYNGLGKSYLGPVLALTTIAPPHGHDCNSGIWPLACIYSHLQHSA